MCVPVSHDAGADAAGYVDPTGTAGAQGVTAAASGNGSARGNPSVSGSAAVNGSAGTRPAAPAGRAVPQAGGTANGAAGSDVTPSTPQAGASGGGSIVDVTRTVAGGPSSGGAAGTDSATPSGPCTGHEGQNVCDGAVLHRCSDNGDELAPETCPNAMLCQIGLNVGACAVCTPGTFHCEEAELQQCSDDGRYVAQSPRCDSAALCNEDVGACTPMVCTPNALSCSSNGSSLKTCNADGSAFMNETPCPNGCNATTKSCNNCMPNAAMCDGDSVVTCSSNGQTMSTKACAAEGECTLGGCTGNACRSGYKATGTPCTSVSGGVCDGKGRCRACLIPGAACGSNSVCDNNYNCVEKLCPNGRVDPGEECDPLANEWKNGEGACNQSCRVTASVYRACAAGSKPCWDGSGWFCSGTGACTRLCTTSSDCAAQGVSAQCIVDAYQPSQRICIPSTSNCQPGTRLQWYGQQGCVTGTEQGCTRAATPMCGWISSDPGNNRLWCPGEYQDGCCPPGYTSASQCIKP